MQLTLTLTISESGFERDISVVFDQELIKTLSILRDNGIISIECSDVVRAKSRRKGTYVPVNKTYEQLGIYNGDVIEII